MNNISHERYQNDIRELEKKLEKLDILNIFGIPRGGHYPAGIIAHDLSVKQIFNPAEITEKTLIVDDLFDSGKTLQEYMQKYPKSEFAVVYAKNQTPKKCYVGQYVAKKWLVFPDENGCGIEENLKRTLQYIGEDTTREGLIETPSRMRKAYDEIFAGYKTNPLELVKTFSEGCCKEMVILKNCEFFSTCEHHFLPFFGHISVGYMPRKKVIGVSKIARLVDCFSKRMQIQERMTAQIADFLENELDALGVFVICEGVHFCMTSRGIRKQDASMITSAIRGEFISNSAARAEFLALVQKN